MKGTMTMPPKRPAMKRRQRAGGKQFLPGQPLQVNGRRVLVVGAARTGVEMANFLTRRGASVTVTDMRGAGDLASSLQMLGPEVQLELGGHNLEGVSLYDFVMPSPGVPMEEPLLRMARDEGVKVLSEIEVAYRFLTAPLIAVTGTNGKSTVITVLGLVLEAAGIPARVGGNIGNPLVGEVDRMEGRRFAVAEISSFQLEWVERFRPWAAAILNISPDHLDRYPDYEAYVRAKARIFENQRRDDELVLNGDDPVVREMGSGARSRKVWFTRVGIPRRGIYMLRGWIYARLGRGAGKRVLPVSDMRLVGEHNRENAMAVTALALLAGASPEDVREVFRSFRGLPHRTQFVDEKGGVRFYDDSKGTNVGATARSLAGFKDPVILIAGGRDKGGSYAPLEKLLKGRVRRLVAIGEARERLLKEVGETVPVEQAGEMGEAVRKAYAAALPGDVVLLSPACSSFDQYSDYAERGRHFQKEVGAL